MERDEGITISEKTKAQMERFGRWIVSAEGNKLSLADKGILYTLIGLTDGNLTIGQVQTFIPDSSKTVNRHLRSLEEKGLVMMTQIYSAKVMLYITARMSI